MFNVSDCSRSTPDLIRTFSTLDQSHLCYKSWGLWLKLNMHCVHAADYHKRADSTCCSCMVNLTFLFILSLGTYAACGFQIGLKRKKIQYLIQVYLPSCMFVVVSWVSFLIKPEVVPGRMGLLVTLFLVLINIFNSVG